MPLRVLILGPAKVGKTLTCIPTMPPGGVFLINSDQAGSADHAKSDRVTESALCEHPQTFVDVCNVARKGLKAGEFKSVVWDTVTEYGRKAAYVYEDAEKDGRRAWGMFARNVSQCVDSLLAMSAKYDAHVVVLAHSVIEEGVVALDISGQSGRRVPASFQDVYLLEKRSDKRVLSTKKGGILGSRSLPDLNEVDCDLGALWLRMQAAKK